MKTMTRGRFRHLPVIEDDALVGIVSIGDVVKRKIEETEQEADALKQYIAS
jgi:CBS domain-containing protein